MCLNKDCEYFKENILTPKDSDLLKEIFKEKAGKVQREMLGFTNEDENILYEKILFAFDELREN